MTLFYNVSIASFYNQIYCKRKLITNIWLSLKRRFGGCGHGFGRCDGLDGLGVFGGFDGLGGFNGFSGFGGFSGFVFYSAFRSPRLFSKRGLL